MRNIPLFSIIVPVYNTELFLEQCVNSICQQTYSNFEIILVDDGSQDDSGVICDICAQKDERIRVIHKENGGLGSTRVAGVKAAKGKYICFVDSDDWIENDYLSEMQKLVTKYDDVRIIVGGYVIDKNAEVIRPFCAKEEKLMDRDNALNTMFDAVLFDWSLCDKVYKKDLFEDDMLLEWPAGYGEDTYSNWKLFQKVEKVLYSPTYRYHYLMHMDSMTHKRISKEKFIYFSIYDRILAQIDPRNKDLRMRVCNTALKVCLPIIYEAESKYNQYAEEIEKAKPIIQRYYNELLEAKRYKDAVWIEKMYLSVNRNREELESTFATYKNELLKFSAENNVYVYGAGVVAEQIIYEMNELGIAVEGIIVSKKRNLNSFWGIEVFELSEFRDRSEPICVVLAMNQSNVQEVIKEIGIIANIKLYNAGKHSLYYYS